MNDIGEETFYRGAFAAGNGFAMFVGGRSRDCLIMRERISSLTWNSVQHDSTEYQADSRDPNSR